jgi:hypothetical protein
MKPIYFETPVSFIFTNDKGENQYLSAQGVACLNHINYLIVVDEENPEHTGLIRWEEVKNKEEFKFLNI